MAYARWRLNWRRDSLGGPAPFADFFNHVEDVLEGLDDRAGLSLSVLVYSGGTYPARPPVPAGYVRYVGPVQPTTWLSGDEWVDTS